jgi:hypothetical protein
MRGKSLEYGCYQHLIPTYNQQSIRVLGYVAPMTKNNVEYVTVKTVDLMLKNQLTVEQIGRSWNQGNTGPCRSGTNSLGVKFNSCQYVKELLDKYNQLK